MDLPSVEINHKNVRGKIISIFLGILFSLVLLELCLRIIGFVDNLNRDAIDNSSKGQYKILTVGNSYTAGAGAPEGQSYPAQLQRMLNKQKSEKYKVINRGRGNVNSTYILENLSDWLKEDRPQIVFVMTGEPNSWNKYGLDQFLAKYKPEERSYISWDFLRWSKVFRFVELAINRKESFISKRYSTFFKNVELTEKNKAQVGYLWLGMLQVVSFKELIMFDNAQENEALEHLNYIANKYKNPLAASSAAQFYMAKKHDTENFLRLNERALQYSTDFNLIIYKKMISYETSIHPKYRERYLKLKNAFEKLPKELPLDVLMDWDSQPFSQTFSSIEEENTFLLKVYKNNLANMKIGERLFYSKVNPFKFFELVESSLKMNPLSPAADLYELLSETVKVHPQFLPKIENLQRDLSIILNDENFKKVFFTDKIEEAWIVHDLDKIVKMIKDSGAKVVVQTYPPYRKNVERFADGVIRKWWSNRKTKSDIEFMDVGLMLNEKFDEKNDGDKYFSQEYGPSDNHQSALGNTEIAKLMTPVVIKLEGREPK